MLHIAQWFREKITAVLSRFKRRQATPPLEEAAVPPLAAAPPPEEPPHTLPEPNTLVGRPVKTAELRRLERRRRRHDKFVIPKGERPLPVHREPKPKPKVEPVEKPPPIRYPKMHVVGKHHEDTQEVLYDESEFFGMFNFRDTILQQLERYFVYLARMKKYDADSYGFYRQYGATLLPYINVGAHDRVGLHEEGPDDWKPFLAEWFHHTRPSFGCFAYGADPETEKYELTMKSDKKDRKCIWVPKFMYFIKQDKPSPTLQMMKGGDIYTMTIWWDRPHDPKFKRKYGTPQQFGIFVSEDGQQIIALRELETKIVSVRSKKKRRGWVDIPQRGWQFPTEFERWARDNGEDAQTFLSRLFLSSVQRHANAQRGVVRIAVSKDDMTAVFSINHNKMGYFFQDRDIHVGETGQRKKIFHMVKAYTRKDGVQVPLHFRGEREFTWAEYNVKITVPGYDHTNFDELDVGFIDEYWQDEDDKPYIHQEEVGKILADKIKRVH